MPTLTWTEVDAIATIGDPISIAALDEIQANVNALNAATGTASSTGTFGGQTGTVVTFAEQADTTYLVVASQMGTPDGSVGEISFVPISTTQARIINTGSAGGSFRFKVVP